MPTFLPLLTLAVLLTFCATQPSPPNPLSPQTLSLSLSPLHPRQHPALQPRSPSLSAISRYRDDNDDDDDDDRHHYHPNPHTPTTCTGYRLQIAALQRRVTWLEGWLRAAHAKAGFCERERQALRDRSAALDARNASLTARAASLVTRTAAVAARAAALDARQRALDARQAALMTRERKIRKREKALRERPSCPGVPSASPAPMPGRFARVCEACGRCRPGLKCVKGVCQRTGMGAKIKCVESETCGVGERRVCRRLRRGNFESEGMLKKELEQKGFFVGTTDGIEGCVMGQVRIDCKRREEICSGAFCILKTIEQCEADGLTEISKNPPAGFALTRQLGSDKNTCCVLLVQLDCYARELCSCQPTRKM